MTDEAITHIVIAVAAAVPPSLVALAGLLQGRANHRQTTDKAGILVGKMDAASVQNETIISTTSDIQQQSNGTLAGLILQLQTATVKIDSLEKQVLMLMGKR